MYNKKQDALFYYHPDGLWGGGYCFEILRFGVGCLDVDVDVEILIYRAIARWWRLGGGGGEGGGAEVNRERCEGSRLEEGTRVRYEEWDSDERGQVEEWRSLEEL